MSSKLTLYYAAGSPLARAILLLARYVPLDIELKHVDLMAGEQRSEEYTKLNPLQKVPVLVDGGFVLGESRAILAYLVSSRNAESDLYPSDPKIRALIDQRLYYDATVVFEKLSALVRPGLYYGVRKTVQKHKDDIREMLSYLNTILEGQNFVAGSHLTIADFSIVTSITGIYELGYSFDEYSNLKKWFERLHSLPGFDENVAGAKSIADLIRSLFDDPLY